MYKKIILVLVVFAFIVFSNYGDKFDFIKDDVTNKVEDIKDDVTNKVENIKDDVTSKVEDVKKEIHDKLSINNDEIKKMIDHDHEDLNKDFKKYLTKEQIEELDHYTSHRSDDLVADENGVVDLQQRFSHAHISYIDENGKKVTREY